MPAEIAPNRGQQPGRSGLALPFIRRPYGLAASDVARPGASHRVRRAADNRGPAPVSRSRRGARTGDGAVRPAAGPARSLDCLDALAQWDQAGARSSPSPAPPLG